MKNGRRNGNGFTIVEVLMTLAVVSIVIAGMFGVFNNLHKRWVTEGLKADMRQNARVAQDNLYRDLEMAGYHVTNYGDANKQNLAITIAEAQVIEIDQHWLDIDAGTYEPRMMYYHLATDAHTGKQNLYRQVRTQPGLPTGDELVAENVTIFQLTYYDEDGNTVTNIPRYIAGSPPDAKLKSIRSVDVTLTTTTERDLPDGTGSPTITLTAKIVPRNFEVEETIGDTVPPATPAGLRVVDTRSCTQKLNVKWNKNTESDLEGYYLFYGPTAKVRVPISGLADQDNPQMLLAASDLLITRYVDRDTTPNTYNIRIAAYDSSGNISAASAAVSANPNPDVTSFSLSGDDTTVNPDTPSPPINFTTAYGNDYEIVLSWEAPADGTATAGYRLYRSDAPFATGTHISETLRIADEATLDETATTYTDTGLLGCTTYYYAIASVNCDDTLVPLYVYTASANSDYATTSGTATDGDPPPAPSLAGSTAGWKRAFLTLRNPTEAESPDFDRTEIYFSEGTVPPALEGTTVVGGVLLPDSDTGVKGTFFNRASQVIVFDSPTTENPAEPELTNEAQYNILAVTYDRCGNTSIESTTVLLISLCGDDPPGPPPEYPINPTYASCDPGTLELTWEYEPKSWEGDNRVFDFAGYRVWRQGPYFWSPEVELTTGPTWIEEWTDAGLLEGGYYYYLVRATDCVYENRNSEFPNNLTDALYIGPVMPGRIRYYEGNPNDVYDPANFVTSFSDNSDPNDPESLTYHNNVRFFIQNTSMSTMTLQEITVTWDNPTALLSEVVIGGGNSATPAHVVAAGNTPSGIPVALNLQLYDSAYDVGQASGPVPVRLRFANLDGSVNRYTDMRGESLGVDIRAQNDSLTAAACTPETFDVDVPRGPGLGGFFQDKPGLFGISSYAVVGENGTARDTDVQVPGSTPVNVIGVVHDRSGVLFEDLVNRGFDDLSLYYTTATAAGTGITPAPPAAASFAGIPLVRVQGNYFGIYDEATGQGTKLPTVDDQVIWYWVLARDRTGNFERVPNPDFGAYAYYQRTSDPCGVTPSAPVIDGSTTPSSTTLTWAAPATYADGGDIPPTDTLAYDIYVRHDETSAFALLEADVTATTYVHNDDMTGQAWYYAVKAKNSCGNESDFSNTFRECEGTSGVFCSLFSLPSQADVGDPVAVAAGSVCLYAGNGITDTATFRFNTNMGVQDVIVTEAGDTGNFSTVVSFSLSDDPDPNVIWTSGGESIPVDFYTGADLRCTKNIAVGGGPCDTVPDPPDPFTGNRPGWYGPTATLTWGKPLFNTDGSTLDDLAGYQLYYRRCNRRGRNCTSYNFLSDWDYPDSTSVTVSGLSSSYRYQFRIRSKDTCADPGPNYSSWKFTGKLR